MNPNSWWQPLPLTSWIGICTFTASTVSAAFQARKDPWTVALILTLYASFMLLFWCLLIFHRLPVNSNGRKRLKVPIWVLSTVAIIVFIYRFSMLMDPASKRWIWAVTGLSCLTLFYVIFILDGNSTSTD